MNYLKSIDRKRFLLMMAGIVGMGITNSFIINVNYGTDTSSFMNLAFAEKAGISFGTAMVITNSLFFIPQVLLERRLIGIGTIANMTLIGYIADFCRMLEARFLPHTLFTAQPSRTIIFIVALIPFLISVALYMNADLGLAPFDSIATIVSHRTKLPFAPVRMGWDFLMILTGILLGRRLNIGTVVMALTVGPVVSFIGRKLKALEK